MTTEKLMDAIGLLPADLITRTDKRRTVRKTRALHWQRWAAMAACLVLVLSVALVTGTGKGSEKMAATQAPGAPAMDVPAEEGMEESAMMDVAPAETEASNEMAGGTWPLPLMILWDTGSTEVHSGNYRLSMENPDGTREETVACGAYPPDANLEPVAAAAEVRLTWAEMPDSITVRCWSDSGEEAAGEVKDGMLTVDPAYPIYEITAVWGEICTASYAVRLQQN